MLTRRNDTMTIELKASILRLLRKLDDRGARMEENIHEIKGRLGGLESGYASLSNHLDRLDDWLARTERRLELRELEDA